LLMEILLYQSLLVLNKQAAGELYRDMKVIFTFHGKHHDVLAKT